MRCLGALLLLALALPAQQPAGRILRIQISTISNQPIVGAKVVVAQTLQEAVSKEGGLLQLRLPPEFVPGSELKISVTYKTLVIHVPLNGDLTVPKDGNKVVTVQLGPKGDKPLLANSARQIVAASIRQQDAPSGPGAKDQEPKLTRYIRQWAADYGFSMEQVQAGVRRWAEEVERKRGGSSLEEQALAAYANKEFEKAADLFKEAAADALPRFEEVRKRRAVADEDERKELRAYLDGVIGQSDALKRSFHYSEARQALDVALPQVDKVRYRALWIFMLNRRANSLKDEAEFGASEASGERFAAATRDYRQLLQEPTGTSDRKNWALAQNNLGNALSSQSERSSGPEATALLAQAVEAYRAALQVYTKSDRPQDWAQTQNNLGNALRIHAERSTGVQATALLTQAVEAYRAALQIRTKVDLPKDWAQTQNNLGNALSSQSERSSGPEATALLAQAVEAYRAALQVYTKSDLPQDWAMTQNNLGSAMENQGERSSGAESTTLLAQAVEAYRAVLQVSTKTGSPQVWATTQNNLGNALVRQGERSSGAEATALLAQAVEAYRAALQIVTKAGLPQFWATTQSNLGNALVRQGERSVGAEATTLLAQAVDAYHAALQVRTRADLPQNWAETQNNLGYVLQSQGERSGAREASTLLAQAVEAYRAALQVRTKADLPQNWAMTQKNLGVALTSQAKRSSGAEATTLLAQAVEAYRAALQVYSQADLPQDWARTQNDLAAAQILQGDWNAAAEATEHVLEVYPDEVDVLRRAEGIYHDHLFIFARAFELNKHRVELDGSVPARLDFAEKHLTTARFRECVERWNPFSVDELKGNLPLVRESLRFACQYGAADNDRAQSADMLLKMADALKKVGRSFAGTKHFVSTSPAFAKARDSWVKLFESLEAGDGPAMAEAVREIQKTM